MIIFLLIFAIGGWSAAFLLLHQRNAAMEEHFEDNRAFRNKIVADLGFRDYVEFSTSSDYRSFTREVLSKTNLVKK